MHTNFYLSPIVASLALTMASSVKAAEPVSLQTESFKQLQQQFHIALPGVSHQASALTINNLQFLKQHTDKNHITHIRLQQEYAGFPVIGGYAIVHSSSSVKSLSQTQKDVSMNGKIYRGLQEELGQPSADFVKNGQVALEKFKTPYQDKEVSAEKVMPVVYIDDNNQAHWAYKVSIFVRHTDKIPERPTAIVDAVSHKPFIQWNDIKTARRVPAKGMGFGGNEKVGMVSYGNEFPLLDITRERVGSTCYMENEDVKVVDMEHEYYSDNKPMRFRCKKSVDNTLTFWTGRDGDGYDRDNGAYSPTNDALYAGYVIKHMYHDWYGVPALTKADGSPMQLVMRVHYGDGYENAYWDGEQMTFGDGESMMYPLVSLGVGGHEISHGFTEQHSNLEYYGQSGGMNEAFSDMAAQAAEFYSIGKSSWQIGAEIMKEDSGWEALRYMDKPSRDGTSIDSADEYRSGLDVHYSSGVYNHLFYILANKPGWDTRKAFDVMVKANMDYWTPYSTFDEGGCGVLSAARDFNYPLEDVKASLDEVAVKYDFCRLNPVG
ncbi:zinc metalloprotease ProA [Legionella clemsonensis]|uniref:Neutral metalloproteinase n=1 Tax=Legionella clemsonensis TaxID=1867846 RepID=A0A222P537_9GAMM|nr:M4 family metallopeptidase [Legionella clemsonensis]ASQ46959.1 Zinc metalloproteinase precursor [Legionella clemsonensis]